MAPRFMSAGITAWVVAQSLAVTVSAPYCQDTIIEMLDSFGDGWNGAVITVGDFAFTLPWDFALNITACLPPGEYFPFACGQLGAPAASLEEITWRVGGIRGTASAFPCRAQGAALESFVVLPGPTMSPTPPSASSRPTSSPTSLLVATSFAELQGGVDSRRGALSLGADIMLTQPVLVQDTSVSIDGQDFALDGQGYVGCMRVVGIETKLVLARIIIRNGNTTQGGGVFVSGGASITFQQCQIFNNSAIDHGGGIYLAKAGRAVLSDTSVSHNHAGGDGGGLAAFRASHVFASGSSTFRGNRAGKRGGGLCLSFDSTASLSSAVTVVDNNAVGSGGGISIQFNGGLDLDGATVSNNLAHRRGGGIFGESTRISISDSTITKNVAELGGGGLHAAGGALVSVRSSALSWNEASGSSGGGLYFGSKAVANITDSVIYQNVAISPSFVNSTYGRCLVVGPCFFSMNYPNADYDVSSTCSFTVLTAATLKVLAFDLESGYDFLTVGKIRYSGGAGPDGINVSPGDVITFEADESVVMPGFGICEQSTVGNGGGLFAEQATVNIVRSTVNANAASSNGGGLSLSRETAVAITDSALSLNKASIAGGGIDSESASSSLFSSSIVNNIAGIASAVYLTCGVFKGTDLSMTGALVGSFTASGATCVSACPAGQYGACDMLAGAPECFVNCVCHLCPSGRASAVRGATAAAACSVCAVGEVAVVAGLTACEACAAGSYASSEDLYGGTIVNLNGLVASCRQCPQGYFARESRSVACRLCAATTWSSPASANCTLCAQGYFKVPDLSCELCPHGAVCQETRSTLSDLEIGAGFWRYSASSKSVYKCPQASACVGGNISGAYCEQGYRGPLCGVCDTADNYFLDNNINSCISCESAQSYAWGSPVVIIALALLSLEIILELAKYYVESGNRLMTSPFPIVEKFFGVMFAFGTFLKTSSAHLYEKVKMQIKLLMVFFQISSNISTNCSIKFPKEMDRLLNSVSVVNLRVFKYLAIPCWGGGSTGDYIDEMVWMTMFPIALSALLALAYYLPRIMIFIIGEKGEARMDAILHRTKSYELPDHLKQFFTPTEINTLKQEFAEFDEDGKGDVSYEEFQKVVAQFSKDVDDATAHRLFHEADEDGDGHLTFREFMSAIHTGREHGGSEFANFADKVEAQILIKQQNLISRVFLVLTFLVLTGSSTLVFNFFKCDNYEEFTLMAEDYSIKCDSLRHEAYSAYAFVMILVYPLGIPLLYLVMLYSRKEVLSNAEDMAREAASGYPMTGDIQFLHETYKPEYWYFEVVECFRRLYLASALGTMNTNPLNTSTIGLLFCLAFLYVFIKWEPFRDHADEPHLNRVGVILSYSLVLLYLAAILLSVGQIDVTWRLAVALILVLFAAPISMVVSWGHDWAHRHDADSESNAETTAHSEVELQTLKQLSSSDKVDASRDHVDAFLGGVGFASQEDVGIAPAKAIEGAKAGSLPAPPGVKADASGEATSQLKGPVARPPVPVTDKTMIQAAPRCPAKFQAANSVDGSASPEKFAPQVLPINPDGTTM